jgi:DNA-binding transcriptional MerR regulator
LRFWETRFTHIKPMKRAGGRRYYRPADLDLVRGIKTLLYKEGYTIRGVQKIFKEEGAATIVAIGRGDAKPDKPEKLALNAPAPGTARAAPRIVKGAPPPGRAPMARPIGEAPKVIHKMTAGQSDTLKAALRDLTDARKLLDPTTRS